MSNTVLIIGGYGVFGGKLADALSADPAFDVIVAGRNPNKAERFCDGKPCRAMVLDKAAPHLARDIAAVHPFIVVDASGPFQKETRQPYRVAEAALSCGAHYLDLSDDASFTSGIHILNEQAITRNLTALSGVSSVPALSSAAVTALARDMTEIDDIESIILPGNRAPRGLSVVQAIVAQAGKPLATFQGGRWISVKGWSDRRTITLTMPDGAQIRRWASLIGAPDLALFPEYFRARSVTFRAGLDLTLLHGGLTLISLPVRAGIFSSLSPLAPALKWIADRLESFGSSTGGMKVSVSGRTPSRTAETRDWTLIVQDGDGPSIPAIPAEILCRKLIDGTATPGARPCLSEFTLHEAESALSRLRTATARSAHEVPPLFQSVLGKDYDRLPAEIRELHAITHVRHWTGRARIERGTSLISRIAGFFAGFPPAGENVPVTVEMTRVDKTETWVRTFGKHSFRSFLSPDGPTGSGRICERFGLMKFRIALQVLDGALEYPVSSARILGLPLPRFLLPRSTTQEYFDAQDRACFDVQIDLPLGGHVVTYSGWLVPDDGPPPAK